MSETVKILLVEDHALSRDSLTFGLNKHPNFEVIDKAINGQDAIRKTQQHQPNIILMDIGMPVLNGIEATQTIKRDHPEIKVIMLTSHNEDENVFSAFAAGADGYCLKDIKLERLAQVIEMVIDGALWLDPAIAGLILKVMPMISEAVVKAQAAVDNDAELSEREKEILVLLTEGLNNKDIADQLCISIYTVKNHVRSIIQKLAVEDRTQAAVYALKKGLI